jgi:hypothetical protein
MLKRRNEIVVKACDFDKLGTKRDTKKTYIFGAIMLCSGLKVNSRFGGTCRLHCYLLHAGFLLGLFFYPEDGGNMLLQDVG